MVRAALVAKVANERFGAEHSQPRRLADELGGVGGLRGFGLSRMKYMNAKCDQKSLPRTPSGVLCSRMLRLPRITLGTPSVAVRGLRASAWPSAKPMGVGAS